MPIAALLFTTTSLLVVSGCTSKQVYQAPYKGITAGNEVQTSPAERVGKPDAPGYQQYEIEQSERNNLATGLADSK